MPIDIAGFLGHGGGTLRPEFAFLSGDDTAGEAVALHVEATSFDPARADLRTVAAIRIRGPRILASGRLVLSFWPTEPPEPALTRLLHHVGARTLVGYYLDFTLAVLNRAVRPMIGADLPNRRVEVSGLYYDRKAKTGARATPDLKLDRILEDLDLPPRPGDDAASNALSAALIYRRLVPAER